jgi:hypothetical protein
MSVLHIVSFLSFIPRYNWNITECGVKHHDSLSSLYVFVQIDYCFPWSFYLIFGHVFIFLFWFTFYFYYAVKSSSCLSSLGDIKIKIDISNSVDIHVIVFTKDTKSNIANNYLHFYLYLVIHIGRVMVSLLASSLVDRGFEHQSCQTKDYTIDMFCFSTKHAALRSKNKNWLVRN